MDKNDFRLLTVKEENLLTLEEKRAYYEKLREYIKKRKLTNTTPLARFVGPRLKNITNKIATSVTKLFAADGCEWLVDGEENVPDGAFILANTHQGILDNFVWLPSTKRHCLILHGQEVNKLLLACQLNTGLVLVRKADKENNLNAKLDMIRLLLEGYSISYFPEGTWNLSPNKLHLPLKYGFLDIARKAGVPVVPAVLEYTYDTSSDKEKITRIHVRYGKPLHITLEDDINLKLLEYEEAISTMRYDLFAEKGITKRKDISNFDYINFLKGNYKNLSLGKLNLKKERDNIFTADDDFHLFHHINDVPFDEEGNLLETDEVIKLTKINEREGI